MLSSTLFDKLDALQAKLQSSTNLSTIGKSQKNYLIHPLILNAIGVN